MGSRPVSFIQIELTNHCNYHCRFCPQSQWRSPHHADVPYDRKKGYMPLDLYKRIIKQADEIAGGINFSFFGEPMKHPEFKTFLECLKHRSPDLSVVMNTNLSLATDAVFETLMEIKIDELRFSIDAASSQTYEIVRPGDSGLDLKGYENKKNRFDLICQKARHWFSIPDHRPTRHVFTVNSINKNEIKTFADYWLPLLGDRDKILFKNILSYGGKIADDLIVQNACNVWDLCSLTVDWQGRVSPCNLDTNMDLTVGSVKEALLLDIFKGQKMRQVKSLSKRKKIIPCRQCPDANNWTRNILLGKGAELKEESVKMFTQNI